MYASLWLECDCMYHGARGAGFLLCYEKTRFHFFGCVRAFVAVAVGWLWDVVSVVMMVWISGCSLELAWVATKMCCFSGGLSVRLLLLRCGMSVMLMFVVVSE